MPLVYDPKTGKTTGKSRDITDEEEAELNRRIASGEYGIFSEHPSQEEIDAWANQPREHGIGYVLRKNIFVICVAILAIISVCFLARHIVTIIRYSLCTGETTAVIEDVESRRAPFKKKRSREYRISYSYYADGAERYGTSAWVSYNHAKPGQEAMVRFDPDRPEDAILEVERNDSVAALSAAAIVFGIVVLVSWTQVLKRRLRRPKRDP